MCNGHKHHHQPKYHNDGTPFREIRKMTNEEFVHHRKALEKFLNHPDLHIPQLLNHENKKSSHHSEISDEHGRKFLLKYDVEHSEHHTFYSLEAANLLNVTETNNGSSLILTFSSIEHTRAAMARFRVILDEKNEHVMLTGTTQWGLKRSHVGRHRKVSFCCCCT